MARKDNPLNKRRVIWEAIRRNSEYTKLYALFRKNDTDKSRAGVRGSYNCMMKIYREFGISNPIDPSKNSSEIPEYLLEMYFHRSVFEACFTWDILNYMHTSKDRYIDLHLAADMTRSPSVLCDAFKTFITGIKKRRKNLGLDKPKKPLAGRQRIQSYDVEDFKIYDSVNEKRRKNKKLTFYQIAKSEVEAKIASSNKKIDSFEKKGKINAREVQFKAAHERVSWIINKGYRSLIGY